MKTLKQYAYEHGIKYRAAWNRFKAGKIPSAFKDEFGKILLKDTIPDKPFKVVCYARVSSNQNKKNLDSQAKRLVDYANAVGLGVNLVIKEVGSGLNDNRKKLIKLLKDTELTHIIVEHKDRLSRFGFNYLQEWMNSKGVKIIVINEVENEVENDRDDLMQDFVSLVTSFVARLYGLRRSKRKTEKLIQELNSEDN